MPFIILILVVGSVVGAIPNLLKLDTKYYINIPIGIIGAFLGAFLGFGDNPIPFLVNPQTMSISVSIVFVAIEIILRKKLRKK